MDKRHEKCVMTLKDSINVLLSIVADPVALVAVVVVEKH